LNGQNLKIFLFLRHELKMEKINLRAHAKKKYSIENCAF